MTLFKLLLMSLRAFLYLDILIHIHSFMFTLPLSCLPPCIPLIVSFFHLSPPLCILIKRLLWGSGIWILSFSLCLFSCPSSFSPLLPHPLHPLSLIIPVASLQQLPCLKKCWLIPAHLSCLWTFPRFDFPSGISAPKAREILSLLQIQIACCSIYFNLVTIKISKSS